MSLPFSKRNQYGTLLVPVLRTTSPSSNRRPSLVRADLTCMPSTLRRVPELSVHWLGYTRRTSSLDMPTDNWLRLLSLQTIGPPHPDSKTRRSKVVHARPPIAPSF